MALTSEQQRFRHAKLGSSDAPRIMAGDWIDLWREKTSRAEPVNLDFVPHVQIGIATEPLHARFYTHHTGIACHPANETLVHPAFEFIVAHLDFLTWQEGTAGPAAAPDTILEAKFTSGFMSDEELVQRYYWQLQHQMLVSGLRRAVLSILRPSAYSCVPIPRNDDDIATLLDTLRAFWWYVENDLEPVDAIPVAAPAIASPRVVDISLHNEFMSWSGILAETRDGARQFQAAEAALKALMPDDARIAFVPPRIAATGADGTVLAGPHDGIVLTRAKDGKLSMRFADLPKKHRDKAEPWQPGSLAGAAPTPMETRHSEPAARRERRAKRAVRSTA